MAQITKTHAQNCQKVKVQGKKNLRALGRLD